MDLRFSPEENKFREELRTFFRDEGAGLDPHQGHGEPRTSTRRSWCSRSKILNAKGWPCRIGPKQWGGADWTPVQHYIYNEELQFRRRAAAAAVRRHRCAGR